MRPTFIWNGVDFSRKFNKFEYEVGYVSRSGGNGGMALDFSMITDIGAWKAVITVNTNGLNAEDTAELISALTVTQPTFLTFLDPRANAERMAKFLPPTITPARWAFGSAAGVSWYDGFTVTLEER